MMLASWLAANVPAGNQRYDPSQAAPLRRDRYQRPSAPAGASSSAQNVLWALQMPARAAVGSEAICQIDTAVSTMLAEAVRPSTTAHAIV
jgi:hypothetical protein